MRVSPQSRASKARGTRAVARRRFGLRRLIKNPDNTIYIGLAGACDPASVAVRHAQTFMRFDRRPSYFSDVFVFTGREDEVILAPIVGADPSRPESLGIIRASCDDFAVVRRHPNIALIAVTLEVNASERMKRFYRAVRQPAVIAEDRRLWSLVADWQPYVFQPDRVTNPLHEGVSHPGTVLARWLLAEAGVEGAPGATEDADAPEHLWAFAKWWGEAMKDEAVSATVKHHRNITDPRCGVGA